jgi:tripartite-type tricarboxylate transporter receptor subunit TctC
MLPRTIGRGMMEAAPRPTTGPMNLVVRVLVFLAAITASGAGMAQGTDYPSRPVKLLVPFSTGGPADAMARLIEKKLNERFGKSFFTANQPGAGGNIGMEIVARATPDGYTLLVVTSSLVVNPSLYADVPYDVYKDLAPITLAAVTPLVLVANAAVPVNSVKELVEYVKANPKAGNIASAGTGTTSHLAVETFKRALGIDVVHIPYNGAGPELTAVLGGHVPFAIMALSSAAPHIKQGTLRALAIPSDKRSAFMPDIPTMGEAGVPGDQDADVMLGVLATGGTPRAVIELLHREITQALTQPATRERLAALGFELIASTPEAFAERIRAEVPKWAKVIRDADIKPE